MCGFCNFSPSPCVDNLRVLWYARLAHNTQEVSSSIRHTYQEVSTHNNHEVTL